VPEETGGISEPFDITENLATSTCHFNLLRYSTLRVGYGYDSFDRTGRSFSNMTDNAARVSLDTVGNQHVTVRALYEFTRRKAPDSPRTPSRMAARSLAFVFTTKPTATATVAR
jgi:hypothetical protein